MLTYVWYFQFYLDYRFKFKFCLFKTPGPQNLHSQVWLKFITGRKNEYATIFGIYTITVELV